MNFFGDLITKVVEIFKQNINPDAKDDETDQSDDGKRLLKGGDAKALKLDNSTKPDGCDNIGYEKMKYINSKTLR